MAEETGLISGRILNRNGGASKADWDGIARWEPTQGILWVHLDYTLAPAVKWLNESSGLSPQTVKALTALDPIPESWFTDNDITFVLRGVNLNQGAIPEEMVSIRGWLDQNRIITTRHRNILSIADLRDQMQAGIVPESSIEFLTALIDRITTRMENIVEGIVKGITLPPQNAQLEQIIQKSQKMLKFLPGQKIAVSKLHESYCKLIRPEDKFKLEELSFRINRYVGDLTATIKRANDLQGM